MNFLAYPVIRPHLHPRRARFSASDELRLVRGGPHGPLGLALLGGTPAFLSSLSPSCPSLLPWVWWPFSGSAQGFSWSELLSFLRVQKGDVWTRPLLRLC